MKLTLAFILVSLSAAAQTPFERTVPVKVGQRIVLQFDYPEVKLQTWDKPEVLIKGTVSINQGEHDAAFQLEVNVASEVSITSSLKDKENIPHRISIKKGDKEYFFKTNNFHDPEVQKFLTDNGNEYSYRTNGIIYDIKLTISVPRGSPVQITSKHGLVEVLSFDSGLTLDCKYGGADVTFPPKLTGRITARTSYGEILSNLGAKFEMVQGEGKHGKRGTEITVNLGSGPEVMVESKYGNVYLRKAK